MNRGYLALAAAAVLAAVIGLYVAIRGRDDAATGHASPEVRAPRNPDSAAPTPAVPPPPAAPSAPVIPAAPTTSQPGVSEYTVGGVRVRDHRSGNRPPIDVPPAVHPPDGRKVPSRLTSEIAQKVRAVMTECAARVPPEARGAAPHLDGAIMISIKDQRVTVTSAIVQIRDVAAAAAAPVKQCIEQNAVGLATSSGNEPDVEDYGITLSLRLP